MGDNKQHLKNLDTKNRMSEEKEFDDDDNNNSSNNNNNNIVKNLMHNIHESVIQENEKRLHISSRFALRRMTCFGSPGFDSYCHSPSSSITSNNNNNNSDDDDYDA